MTPLCLPNNINSKYMQNYNPSSIYGQNKLEDKSTRESIYFE